MEKEKIDKIIHEFYMMQNIRNSSIIANIERLNRIRLILGQEEIKYYEMPFTNILEVFIKELKITTLNIIRKLSDEQRESFFSQVPNFVWVSIFDDDRKTKLLKITKEYDNKLDIIIMLADDDKKISFLDLARNELDRANIIASMQKDENKLRLLEGIEEDSYKRIIIQSIRDDDLKIQLLDSVETEGNKLEIIKSIYDENKVMYALSKVNDEFAKAYQLTKELEGKSGNSNKNYKYKMLNLPRRMTIGIEIESEGICGPILPNCIGKWEAKEDDSLLKGGVEYISPIMHDSEENVKQIYLINEILQNLGMSVSENCGGHIHIGADFIQLEEGFTELLELWGNAEEIYFLISNRCGELPRETIWEFAMPISKEFERTNLKPTEGFLENAKEIQYDRYTSLNLMNVNNGKNTIEFRLSNGTLDGDTWIENIRLYGRTIQLAESLGKIEKKLREGEKLTEEERTKYWLKEMLKEDISLDEKMEILMQILFDNEEEREVYEKRYDVNKRLERKIHKMDRLQFGKVDFKKIYSSVEIPEEVEDQIHLEETISSDQR